MNELSNFFYSFFVGLLALGRPERSSTSTDIQKTLSGLKNVLEKRHE
jgi:hypothetical protein